MIEVRSCARLHLGLLDHNGGQGRLYGSIGVAINAPSLVLLADKASSWSIEGLDADRAEAFALRFLDYYHLPQKARLTVTESIPRHIGLGSGTQLGLAVGVALAKINGLQLPVTAIAEAIGRGAHSGIGVAAFQHGGFILDGGRRVCVPAPDSLAGKKSLRGSASRCIPPVLFQRAMPGNWFFVLIIPAIEPGLCDEKEKRAFLQLPPAPESVIKNISWILLMKMLPALVEKDIANFGNALTAIQHGVGDCFASVQGGRFADPLLEKAVGFLLDHGAAGAGQSSWGPTVYGIVEGKNKAQKLAEEAMTFIRDNGGGQVLAVQPQNHGARIKEINQDPSVGKI